MKYSKCQTLSWFKRFKKKKKSPTGRDASRILPSTRGLHGLKTEARTRPVPEIVWPDPTRAARLNLEPEPDPRSPPPPNK